MFAPLRAALPRASSFPPAVSLYKTQLRGYIQQRPQQQPSPTAAFYRTFTRPVAKCALLAVLVYQLVYFGWTKLEVEELKQEREAEIIKLEAQIRSLQAAQAAAEAAEARGAASASDSVRSISDGNGDDRKQEAKARGSWWSWR
ncbi:uncharacterized protein B0T15DRAFT_524846 [Chaetomium strumarium]|uniref:Inner membrane assembly complex subunit 17 n=1 Tax=Chaetomium strumarium TaxID=1170767 RepID=A0AAJ0M4D5_9PEZI|nr:hypothetical protein B0T15DRAFT_524846 [Chaetomium strumarium]